MKVHEYYIYILSNKANTVFYICVTNDLQTRVAQHKQKLNNGFAAKYNCDKLVYYEEFQWIQDAIASTYQGDLKKTEMTCWL